LHGEESNFLVGSEEPAGNFTVDWFIPAGAT